MAFRGNPRGGGMNPRGASFAARGGGFSGGGFNNAGQDQVAPSDDGFGQSSAAPGGKTDFGTGFGARGGRGGGRGGGTFSGRDGARPIGGTAPDTNVSSGFGASANDGFDNGGGFEQNTNAAPANDGFGQSSGGFSAPRGGGFGPRGGGARGGGGFTPRAAPAAAAAPAFGGGFDEPAQGGFGNNDGFSTGASAADNNTGGFGAPTGGFGGGRGRGGGAGRGASFAANNNGGGFGSNNFGAPSDGGFGSNNFGAPSDGGFGGGGFDNGGGFGGSGFGGGGGFGGGSGGGSGCRNCGQDGHFARECPEPKKSSGGCHNCGQEGHFSRECPEPRKSSGGCRNCGEEGHFARECPNGRSGGGGGGACYNCGGEGHMSRDCPEPRKEGGGGAGGPCYNCGGEGHISRDCPEERKPRNTEGLTCYNCNATGHMSRDCPQERVDDPDRKPAATHIPEERAVEELYQEDEFNANSYQNVADEDEDVVVTGGNSDFKQIIENWKDANFETQLFNNIVKAKYLKPRKIQAYTIPILMDGRDVKGQAETGSGKTAAFMLPIINNLMRQKAAGQIEESTDGVGYPLALVILPTRELCIQVFEQGKKFADGTGVTVAKAYGQYEVRTNLMEIRRGCDILCGTPGRLKHFLGQGRVSPKKIQFLVLDEADRLLEDSFLDDLKQILGHGEFPPKDQRQTMLFSATFSTQVQQVAEEVLRQDNVMIANKRFVAPSHRVLQRFMLVPGNEKKERLLQLLQSEHEKTKKANPDQEMPKTLVFVETKRNCDLISLWLCQKGIKAQTIHADRTQDLRERVLTEFRTGKVSVLVSTDVCARGIDIKDLDHVINVDMPQQATTYVHRIGRTGRVKAGTATSFFDAEDRRDIGLAADLVKFMQEVDQEPPDFLMAAGMNGGNGADEWGGGGFGGGAPSGAPVELNNDDW